MKTTETIFIALIEGIKAWVPAEAEAIDENRFQILHCKEYDPEDNTSFLQFIPGDLVQCAKRKDKNDSIFTTAHSLISSQAPASARRSYMLKYLIIDQERLTTDQVIEFQPEIEKLISDIRQNYQAPYHPVIVRWTQNIQA